MVYHIFEVVFGNLGISCGGFQVLMAEYFLYCTDTGPILKHVGSTGMTHEMRSDADPFTADMVQACETKPFS